ncbi:hypothetical protein ACFL0M_13085 [Thermodesulfobacteriota bacterium]
MNTYAGFITAPPGVPAQRVEYLRIVFEKVMANKELIEKLNSAKLDPLYTPGKDLEQFIRNTLVMDPEKLRQWKNVMGIK